MVGPKWIDTRTQPIALATSAPLARRSATLPDPPAEVQLGGADVLTYREMMRALRAAPAAAARP